MALLWTPHSWVPERSAHSLFPCTILFWRFLLCTSSTFESQMFWICQTWSLAQSVSVVSISSGILLLQSVTWFVLSPYSGSRLPCETEFWAKLLCLVSSLGHVLLPDPSFSFSISWSPNKNTSILRARVAACSALSPPVTLSNICRAEENAYAICSDKRYFQKGWLRKRQRCFRKVAGTSFWDLEDI